MELGSGQSFALAGLLQDNVSAVDKRARVPGRHPDPGGAVPVLGVPAAGDGAGDGGDALHRAAGGRPGPAADRRRSGSSRPTTSSGSCCCGRRGRSKPAFRRASRVQPASSCNREVHHGSSDAGLAIAAVAGGLCGDRSLICGLGCGSRPGRTASTWRRWWPTPERPDPRPQATAACMATQATAAGGAAVEPGRRRRCPVQEVPSRVLRARPHRRLRRESK